MLESPRLAHMLSFVSVFVICSAAFGQGEIVRVTGTTVSDIDSTALSVPIFYEKLPYYDDMGMATTKEDGSFEFMLLKDISYIFRVDNVPGMEPFEQEVLISDPEEDNAMSLTLYLPKTPPPPEPPPVEVEPEEELITLDNLTFASGSPRINQSSNQSLDEFITYLNERPNVLIQLEGHTDFQGGDDANLRLSQARVDAVADYLISGGIKKKRITTKAFGGTQPLSRERTPEAKAMNRRVEVRLIRQN